MVIDLDEYVKEYFHITREEMEKIRIQCSSDDWFEAQIESIHNEREREKHGRASLRPQPLAQFIPVVHQIYTRGSDVPEILGTDRKCVLFKKQDTEFQRVDLGYVKLFPLSTCWVSSPAYSSLIIEVDLSEFGSGRKIGNGTIKLLPQQGLMSGGSLLLDDIDIKVGVAWFSPQPLGRNDYKCSTSLPQITTKMLEEMETKQSSTADDDDDGESPVDDESEGGILDQKIEEMDTDGDDEYSDDDDDDNGGVSLLMAGGQHGGFAAIHYSIFEEAVRVTIKVLLNLKTRSFDVNPKDKN
ncbi:hypothetical protein Leryth_015261 [Lithospermum erythrorhizon]|nr:hypothetical protein Leryth_015261 [Lithospermum erythrorhizon]